MDIRKKVVDAFYNTQTGLTRNIAKLKEKNPGLEGIPADTIRTILDQEIVAYNRNTAPLRKKERLRYHTDYIGQLLHVDLMFIASPRNTAQQILIKDEDGEDNRYVLIIVDTYSRYIWAYPLKTKAAAPITKLIRDTIGFIREFFYGGYSGLQFTVFSDAGKEFSTTALEKIPNVKHKIAREHAALAETAIYRLRTKIKYLDGGENKRKLTNEEFVSLIQNLNLDSGADAILEKDALPKEKRDPVAATEEPLFQQGDFVRVRRQKKLFEKASGLAGFSEKVLMVGDSVWHPYDAVWVYKLVSTDGAWVSTKSWLAQDLAKVPFTSVVKGVADDSDFTEAERKALFLTH